MSETEDDGGDDHETPLLGVLLLAGRSGIEGRARRLAAEAIRGGASDVSDAVVAQVRIAPAIARSPEMNSLKS